MARKNNDKVEVEIEVGDREVEIEIDPETGEVTVAEDGDSKEPDDQEAASAAEPAKKRGPGLVLGILVGGMAGAIGAVALVRQLASSPTEAAHTPQDAPEGGSDDLLGQLRARWRVATLEGRLAAQEAEREKLARYKALTGGEPK